LKAASIGAITVALTLSACGSTTSDTSSSGAEGGAGGQCGTVPTNVAVTDSSGVIEALGEPYTTEYPGYAVPVQASKYVDWKPAKTAGFKVGVLYGPFGNGFQTANYEGIVAGLKESPKVDEVITSTMTTIEASEGLQKYQSLIQQGVDLIVFQPPANSASMIPAVQKAGEAGIPSISVVNEIDSPYVVNFTPNAYQYGAQSGAAILKNIGGKGNLLEVQGIAGIPVNDINKAGFEDAVKLCPDAKIVGEVTGGFVDGTAQSSVLKYLSSQPAPIAGVWEAGAMAIGVRGAFDKLGRDFPAVAGSAEGKGYLAYMANNPEYKGVSRQIDPGALGRAAAYAALKMLNGDGVKINAIVFGATTVTPENVAQWNPGTDEKSVDAPTGPANLLPDMQAYVDKLFTK
jgi:ribose transport system substrate-binding protein